MCDILDHTKADGGVDGNSDRPYMPAAQANPNLGMQRHNGGFNALFLDGHVEQLRPGPDTSAKNFEWWARSRADRNGVSGRSAR